MFQLSTDFITYITNVVAMNKLSRLICVLLAASPFAIYFSRHLSYLESSDELFEDIVVVTTTVTHSRTHKPPVTKPASEEIIISQASNNLSSMVNLIWIASNFFSFEVEFNNLMGRRVRLLKEVCGKTEQLRRKFHFRTFYALQVRIIVMKLSCPKEEISLIPGEVSGLVSGL